jgi:2-succinyl-5-enolpyruvyl-6-hydroxy-3-cyclohexene-1-carboxylate synthase
VIVAGAGCGAPAAVLALARALGWPVLAEPRSGLRVEEPEVVATADSLLRVPGFADAHRPEVVLRLGARWASKVVSGFLASGDQVVVDPTGRWSDPERAAETVVRADPSALCRALAAAVAARAGGQEIDGAWLVGWRAAEATARDALSGALAPGTAWGEPALAHRLFAALPAGATLVVSSSMPVRDIEAFALPRVDPPRVLANRGANGIDGVVSTALGVALAGADRGPTAVLVGDLAFLHDVSALVGPDSVRPPLTVVVADNGGGGIFSFLPQAAAVDPAVFARLFGTAQGHDIGAVAAGLGWRVETVDGTASGRLDGLEAAVGRCLPVGGVVHVRLPGTDENVGLHRRAYEAVAAALAGG